MADQEDDMDLIAKPSPGQRIFGVDLHKVPIRWDLEKGTLSFFGLDSALFWTEPSLVNMLAPLVEEMGVELFRLHVAHSSSLGTEEDYHAMVSALGETFEEGFLAWGRAVSTAGWGCFEMPEFSLKDQTATVIIRNSWEISAQRKLAPEKRWGCPFLLGKLIGIFNHAFGGSCWAGATCYYDADEPYIEVKLYPSDKTIEDELKKLRYEHMMEKERELADLVDQKTAELQQAKKEIEQYSMTLEQKVGERTAELLAANRKLESEIEFRKEIEVKKELLIEDLQKSLNEVKTLRGLLPICSSCKKIRDDKGYWNQIEYYVGSHSDAQFSHGICPECAKKLYGDLYQEEDENIELG